MKLRRKKYSDFASRQVFQSAVISLELSWSVIRREKRKQLQDLLIRDEWVRKFKGKSDQTNIQKLNEAV